MCAMHMAQFHSNLGACTQFFVASMGEIPDYATIPMPLLTIFGDVFFDVLETLQLWV